MKKMFLFAALVLLVAASSAAQLLVRPNGTVRIGKFDNEDQGLIPESLMDTITALQIYNATGDPELGRISFGLQLRTPLNAIVGREIYSHNNHARDQIWTHGRNGMLVTAGSAATDTILRFRTGTGENFFDFRYPVKSEGVLLTSDERYKQDINDLDGALETLAGLRSVTYHYKANPSPLAKVDMSTFNTEEAMKAYAEEQQNYAEYEAARTAKLRYGFIAQEVEQVMPELVERDADGMLSVDYIAVIPILVKAVNELSARNEQLENQLRQLTAPEANRAPAQSSGMDQLIAGKAAEVLAQNDPNPFNSDTRIAYSLPEGTQQAAIYIYDLQGKQVRQLPVADMGAGSVTLHGGDLQAGMYIYSLIADGHELASKKMILTK